MTPDESWAATQTPEFQKHLREDAVASNKGTTHEEFKAGVRNKTMGFKCIVGEPCKLLRGSRAFAFMPPIHRGGEGGREMPPPRHRLLASFPHEVAFKSITYRLAIAQVPVSRLWQLQARIPRRIPASRLQGR